MRVGFGFLFVLASTVWDDYGYYYVESLNVGVPVSYQRGLPAFSSALHGQHPHQADVEVSFGSSSVDGGGSNWGDEGDEEQTERNSRREKVKTLLKEQDKEFREERKKKQWGKFANVKTKEDLEPLLAEERKAIAEENKKKADIAANYGVTMELLEPQEEKVFDESGNVMIKADTGGHTKGWFDEVDEELKQEWEDLVGQDQKVPGSDDEDSDDDDDDTKSRIKLPGMDNLQLENGKIVSKDRMQGVRVGSAGGWTLEVFPGDFVVHRKYGIGRFEKTCLRSKSRLSPEEKEARDQRRGEILTTELRNLGRAVTQQEIQEIRGKFGTEEDTDPISNPQTTVLEITYADAVVHVPIDRAYRLSRYRAGDAIVKPRLSKVKGETWANAKRKVEENTLQLAQDVLALYATRETLQRTPNNPTVETSVKEFEKSFPFEPTPDQQKCFEDVENDMVWRNRPMDRLVCGDVGFGKTEVAIRALYRAVTNGKQAALLAPTGVLAAQHFKNVVKRMGEGTKYNMNIALLRGGMGKNTKAGKAMRAQIADGEVNLIVGTHALLSNDMKFKDLGLLVVDEEQRFGVKQKERLKLISGGIDVLTLSATPIPRTLQMSLSGIRDTSTIRSPPPMRKPTITYVQEFSDDIVKDAIERELARNGQCYYVVPRISQLEEAEKTINKLFPHLTIIMAHGRMHRNGAEENVSAFAEGKYDILLATTVIENGVDIPSVNTIIIQNSQAFGMSTLYQLRGRVGRSNQQAYAYFLHAEESITEQAAMRLQAIGELNELGSGFDVANRDLEIRGAGSLLGTEQSGMAAKVGFDLYMRMLKKSIRKLRGLDLPLVPRTNMLILPRGSYENFVIPEALIPDPKLRQSEEGKARLAETNAKLVQLTNTWKKKFGALPSSMQVQLKKMHLHCCTRRLGIDLVGVIDAGDGTFDCVLRSPGLRPRHLSIIGAMLPRGALPRGLNVLFPQRFSVAKANEEEFEGGKKMDLQQLLADNSLDYDNDEDNWDAMDQEEVEAMKEITSANSISSMDEIDIEQYPRFIIKNFNKDKAVVDQLLKLLLPVSKVVFEEQEKNIEQAKTAAELRKKQSLLKVRKKQTDKAEARSLGYRQDTL